jgi:hypothetical protein
LNNTDEELEATYLLGKLDFIIGDFENLNLIIKKFKNYIKNNDLNEKFKNYYQILYILSNIIKEFDKDFSKPLNEIRKFTQNENNESEYYFCTMLLVKNFIKLNKLGEAYNILISGELIKICGNNLLFEAERNYIIGAIVDIDASLDSKSQMDYFSLAYDKISYTHITELTWKVLYALTNIYNNRGNLKKALSFGKYAMSLINFIAENIKDYRLRNIYLEEDERKEAIEKLISLGIKLEV